MVRLIEVSTTSAHTEKTQKSDVHSYDVPMDSRHKPLSDRAYRSSKTMFWKMAKILGIAVAVSRSQQCLHEFRHITVDTNYTVSNGNMQKESLTSPSSMAQTYTLCIDEAHQMS